MLLLPISWKKHCRWIGVTVYGQVEKFMKLVEADRPGTLLCICCQLAGELCEADGPDVLLCVCVASQLENFVKVVEADGPGDLFCICCQSARELCETV